MSKKIDITGQKFGKRMVIKDAGRNKYGQVLWLTRCDCGREDLVISTRLRNTQCCRVCQVTKHGESRTRLYTIWSDMKQRCQDDKQQNFKYYGGRGISVCTDWQAYLPFRDWALLNGYKNNLTIDRINVDGNYEPSNCQWISIQEQNVAGKKRSSSNNSSGDTGVYYRKDTDKWFAGIGLGKRFVRSTCFNSKEEAIEARSKLLSLETLA